MSHGISKGRAAAAVVFKLEPLSEGARGSETFRVRERKALGDRKAQRAAAYAASRYAFLRSCSFR